VSSDATAGDALPATLYAAPEAFQRERRTIFQNAWLLLARSDALSTPGAYAAQSLGGWPVFAIADAAGRAAAFRNVCRHQGLPLFDTGTGTCAEIRCRYHSWAYGADGRFLTAPPQVMPPDPADPMHHLEPITARPIAGLFFVHLGGTSTAADAILAELADGLAGADLARLPFQAETVTDIDANWKVVIEQALVDRPARRFVWPTLLLDIEEAGVTLHQVIPRAFQRTRVHHHHYGAERAHLMERTAAETSALKAAAVAAQAQAAQGTPPALTVTPTLAAFRTRARAAHAAVA